jgi:hypothetical protein
MRILSIDVGIKNLALCVFDILPGSFSVIEWKTVNLISQEEESRICTCVLAPKNKNKNKSEPKQCGKKAKYCDPDGVRVYCDKHAKLVTEVERQMPSKETTEQWWKKKPVAEVADEYARVTNQPKTNKDDMVRSLAKYYSDRSLIAIQPKKGKSANDVSLVDIGRAIKVALLQIAGGIDCVIIENQISTIAARMKTIQGMIAQTFIMLDREIPVDIQFVSSSNKLKGLIPDKDGPISGTKAKYTANKKDSVKICAEFIAQTPELAGWIETFRGSKKKDDLGDCFLQGIWFLKTRKYIDYADNLRINSV